MKTIHLKCGHKIQVKTWPSRVGLAKVRHHYKKFHPARMKKMTKKSLATKRKKGLINPYQVEMGAGKEPYTVTFRTKKELDKYLGKAKKHHPYFRVLGVKKVKQKKNRCKNPSSKSTLIYDKLLGIEARKGHGKFSGQNFKHDFKSKTDAMVLGNPDGSLTIRSKKGKRLWKKFDY